MVGDACRAQQQPRQHLGHLLLQLSSRTATRARRMVAGTTRTLPPRVLPLLMAPWQSQQAQSFLLSAVGANSRVEHRPDRVCRSWGGGGGGVPGLPGLEQDRAGKAAGSTWYFTRKSLPFRRSYGFCRRSCARSGPALPEQVVQPAESRRRVKRTGPGLSGRATQSKAARRPYSTALNKATARLAQPAVIWVKSLFGQNQRRTRAST